VLEERLLIGFGRLVFCFNSFLTIKFLFSLKGHEKKSFLYDFFALMFMRFLTKCGLSDSNVNLVIKSVFFYVVLDCDFNIKIISMQCLVFH